MKTTHGVTDRNFPLRYGSDGKLGVLGDVHGYHFNPEEQNRGSLHYHGIVWLKYKPDAHTFRQRLKQPEFQARVLEYLSDIIKHEKPAQWQQQDASSVSMLSEYQQKLQLKASCSHCPNKHDQIVQTNTAPNKETAEQFLTGRISDPTLPDFRTLVMRDLTVLVDELVTHDENHHASCFKYERKSKRKFNKQKQCRYHFPKELGTYISHHVLNNHLDFHKSSRCDGWTYVLF